ncbi:MAG: flagellar hook-basal body protein [Campylobacterota bacterium]|nr:flagellar hook-basal body protein [Campylobacterota bacterium]
MTQGIHQLTASMVNQLNRVDIVSNNLANANTVGYKEESVSEGTFNHYLEKSLEEKRDVSKLSYIMNTIPKIDNKFLDTSIGSVVSTGNNLDIAITQQDKYFKIQLDSGEIQLTRDGEFKVLNGNLVTKNGDTVLNKENEPIAVNSDIFYQNIAIVSSDIKNLEKSGNNNYKIKDSNELQDIENNREYILQGSIEKSNVNTIKTMVQLIESQRKFEQAQKAITGINDIDKKVITDVGAVR